MKSVPRTSLLFLLLAGLAGGCVRVWANRLTLPATYELVRRQLVFHSDFPLASQHRLFEDLTVRRTDLQERLEVPVSDEPIHVYLFDDARQFDTFVHLYHPEFPERRAFFLQTDTRLMVYAQWGDCVAEDLRHEITHAYLHAVVPNLPIWLDEGLAEYFEVPRGCRGLNRDHLEQLLARLEQGTWRPDLDRLEALNPAFEMTADDYAESWAWVHFLLETPLERHRILPDYLADLRREGSTLPVSARLRQVLSRPERALVEYVRRLGKIGRS